MNVAIEEGQSVSVKAAQHAQDIADARGGDSDALGRLIVATEPCLRSIALQGRYAKLSSRYSADDIFQGAMVRVVKSFSSFRGTTMGEFVEFCKVCVKHQTLELVKYHHAQIRDSREESTTTFEFAEWSRPSKEMEQSETISIVLDELAKLPVEYAEAIRLNYFSELSVTDTATRMGKSVDATKGILKRAKESLRKSRKLATCF